MLRIGYMANIKEGTPPRRDFTLFRIASMDETLRTLGAKLFVFSPRQIDPKTGLVTGFEIGGGGFVPARGPVPEVNGSWFIGRNRSSNPTMTQGQFKNWAHGRGIDVYPLYAFSSLLKDKQQTFRLIRDLDPKLNPDTATYRGTPAQLKRFLRRCEKVFVKPRKGSKGNDIFSIQRAAKGFQCTFYSQKRSLVTDHPTLSSVSETINRQVGKGRFLIQQGVDIDRYNNAPFIFRVIMLDDGEQWQWVHKAVLAAPGSEIANTTQGGSNWTIMGLLTEIYGSDKASALFQQLQRVSFDIIRQLDDLFPGNLMEVGFDFVLDTSQNIKLLEINTLPGMTKPGLPPEPAFADIFNRQASEREIFDKLVTPHGSCLARYLHSKLERRRSEAERPLTRSVDAKNRPPDGARIGPALSAGTSAATAPAPQSGSLLVDPEAPPVHRVIAKMAQYLIRGCLADGSFRYRENMNPDVQVKPIYSVRRHAGAIDALNCFDRWHSSPEARDAAQRAGQFLKDRCIAPIPGKDRFLGIWSRSEINQRGRPDEVRVGVVGVGLLALVGLERQLPGFTALDDLRALAEFLLWAQREDGGFPSHFLRTVGVWKEGRRLAQPLQAALGLLALHDLDPSKRWVQAAADAVAYAVRTQGQATDDYLALLAIARLLPVYQDVLSAVGRGAIVDHAKQLCEGILSGQIRSQINPALEGCLVSSGGTLPTATGLQGLMAAQTFVGEEDPEFVARNRSAITSGIEFLMRACVSDGPYAGAMPRVIGPMRGSESVPTVKHRATEIRIDYLQHALCAMIQYAQLSEGATTTSLAAERSRAISADGDVANPRRDPPPRAKAPDKLLFTPGPLTTSCGVKEAMLRDVGSRDADFIATVQRIRDALLRLAGVSRDDGFEAVPMQGSGTFAIESVLSSTVPADGALLVISNGAYGDRIAEIASRLGIDVEVLRFPEVAPPDLAAVERSLAEGPQFTHVAAVHCETSTGMLNPVGEIGALVRKQGRSFLIDSMSAFGAVPVDLVGWGVDYLVSSANKCIEGVPGFAFVLCRRAALEASRGRARSFSLDLFAQWARLQQDGQFRFTPPTHSLLAFEAALSQLEAEGGSSGRGARYRANQACLLRGMRELGFNEYLPEALQGPIITSFRYPDVDGFDFPEFYGRLNAKGFAIYPGKTTEVDCFRIGTIGHIFQRDVQALVGAIGTTLHEMGVNIRG